MRFLISVILFLKDAGLFLLNAALRWNTACYRCGSHITRTKKVVDFGSPDASGTIARTQTHCFACGSYSPIYTFPTGDY